MGALPRTDGGGSCRNFRATEPSALREDSPSFLLDRDAAKTRLQSQAVSYLIIEIADDDRRHADIVLRYRR
jgi:hypothetical protein